MKPVNISEIKKEMATLPKEELIDLCLRLVRYKKENKELTHYLLFQEGDEDGYINSITEDVEEEFKHINTSNLYFAKKSLRRILRMVKKHIKYSGKKETEVKLLIFYCRQLKKTKIPLKKSKVLMNLYQRQIQTIKKSLATLHEDLQYDYRDEIDSLEGYAELNTE